LGLSLAVGFDPAQQVAEVGAGELPGERPGDLVVAGLERGEAVADLVQEAKSLGVRTLRWTTEK